MAPVIGRLLRPSRDRYCALALVGLGVVLVISGESAPAERAKFIHVRWRPEVTAPQRVEVERRLWLANGQRLEDRTFGYDLLNDSRWNIFRLVRHPAVEDTSDIDRGWFVVSPAAAEGSSRRIPFAERWGVQGVIAALAPGGLLLLIAGLLMLLRPWLPSTKTFRKIGRAVAAARSAVIGAPLPGGLGTAALAVLAIAVLRGLAGRDASAGFVDPLFLVAGGLLTFYVVSRSFRAPRVVLAIVALTVWYFPARASEADYFITALVLLGCHRYVHGPGIEGPWFLALCTIGAATYQPHRLPVIAAAAGVALAARHVRDGWRTVGRAWMTLGGALAVAGLVIAPLGAVPASVRELASRVIADVNRLGEVHVSHNAQTLRILWAPTVDPAQRRAKEREYLLAEGRPDADEPGGRTWVYRWDPLSPADIRRMLTDPSVQDTHGINRDLSLYRETWADARIRPGARLTWVIVPIAALVFLGRRAAVVLPALMLCLPVIWLVLRNAADIIPVAAPVVSALTMIAMGLLTGAVPASSGPKRTIASSSAPDPIGAWSQHSPAAHPGRFRTPLDTWILVSLTVLTIFVHLHVNLSLLNDHAAYLAMARQMVYGDWPIRDFRDDGSLLQILLSAAVQKIGGFHMLGEMLLAWAFIAAANCLAFWLALRLSGSRIAAAAATILVALFVPRPYAYPKIFIYPLAMLVLWRYIDRPHRGRLASVAGVAALAFLFRIDHGVVILATSVATVIAVHAREPHNAVRRAAQLGAWFLLFALPQLAYITWSVGVPRYIESVTTFGGYARSQGTPWLFALSMTDGLLTQANAVVFLVDVFLIIGIASLVRGVWLLTNAWRRGSVVPREALWGLVVAVMWFLMLPILARDHRDTRIPDFAQPMAILGPWMATLWVSRGRRLTRWTVLSTVLVAVTAAICSRDPVVRFFTGTRDVLGGAPFQAERLKNLATSVPINNYAPPGIGGERWLVRYAAECTQPGDRLLVTWFGPEVHFYAGRAFAGDRWGYLPFDNSLERQRDIVDRLQAQSVPLVFVDTAEYPVFRKSWSALAAYLDERYSVATDIPYRGRPTRVLVDKRRTPSSHIAFNQLPCFS
jgi:hypothetical protein